jgi:hypothetical protein
MVQGKRDMPLQRAIALCGLVLTVTCGCLSPTAQGERIDVVSNPELVKYCTPIVSGTNFAGGRERSGHAIDLCRNVRIRMTRRPAWLLPHPPR